MTWDPAQYLKYADERRRPALDLIARIPLSAGNDCRRGLARNAFLLAERWPALRHRHRQFAAMLARARRGR
jgi:trans-aconitate 2-methyltransferase